MDLSSLKRDREKISGGRWIKDLDGAGDLQLKVRGLGSEEAITYRTILERKTPRSDKDRNGMLKPMAGYRVLCEMIAEKVLLDWKGLTDSDGKEIKYTPAKAKEIMMDKDYGPFHDLVVGAAQIVDKGYDEAAEETGKN